MGCLPGCERNRDTQRWSRPGRLARNPYAQLVGGMNDTGKYCAAQHRALGFPYTLPVLPALAATKGVAVTPMSLLVNACCRPILARWLGAAWAAVSKMKRPLECPSDAMGDDPFMARNRRLPTRPWISPPAPPHAPPYVDCIGQFRLLNAVAARLTVGVVAGGATGSAEGHTCMSLALRGRLSVRTDEKSTAPAKRGLSRNGTTVRCVISASVLAIETWS